MKSFSSPSYYATGIMIAILVIIGATFVSFRSRIQPSLAAVNKNSALPIHALNYWLDGGTPVPSKTSHSMPIRALNYWLDDGTSIPSKSISSMPIHALNYWLDGSTSIPSVASNHIPVTGK